MKNTIAEFKARSEEEDEMLQMDMGFCTLAEHKEDMWDGSPAQKHLKNDIENEACNGYKPKQLWLSRPEYQTFTLKQFRDQFRDHIKQEKRAKVESNYWLVKKRKKQRDDQSH